MTSKVTQLNQPPTCSRIKFDFVFSALKQKHFKSELKQVWLVIDEILKLRTIQNMIQCYVHVNCQADAIKHQCAKEVVSDSPGLVDFAIGLVNSVINLLNRQMKFFLRNSNYRRTVKSMCSSKRFWD